MADTFAWPVHRRGAVLAAVMAVLVLAGACGKSGTATNTFGAKKDDKIAAEVPDAIKSKGSVTVRSEEHTSERV